MLFYWSCGCLCCYSHQYKFMLLLFVIEADIDVNNITADDDGNDAGDDLRQYHFDIFVHFLLFLVLLWIFLACCSYFKS